MTIPTKYRMSFTTGGLFLNESIKIAKVYQQLRDWEKTKEKVFQDNLLQYSSQKTTQRVFREIKIRLQQLNKEMMDILIDGDRKEQQVILWIAICKAYKFIGEFSTEIIREKYLMMNHILTSEDYMSFYNSKADWHEELDNQSDMTIQKQRQVVFRMLHEAEILSSNDTILPIIPSFTLFKILYKDNPSNLTYLPISDMDIKELLTHAQ